MSYQKILYLVFFLISSSLGGAGFYSFYGLPSYASEKVSPSIVIRPLRQIYIGGGVRKPGIYQIPKGSLIYQAIQLAGGLTATAKVESKFLMQTLPKTGHILIADLEGHLNQKLEHKMRNKQKTRAKKKKSKPTKFKGKIFYKKASLSEWMQLPGIGPKLAARIVKYRKEKSLKDIQDLLNVKGIGQKRLSKLGQYLK